MLYILLVSLLFASAYYIFMLKKEIEKLNLEIEGLESSYTIVKDAYDETKNKGPDKSVKDNFSDYKKNETYINNGCKNNVNHVTTDSNTYRHFNDGRDPDLSNSFFNPTNIAMTSLMFGGSSNNDLDGTDEITVVNTFDCEMKETESNHIQNDGMEKWDRMECTYNDDTGLTCDDSSFDSGGSFED